MPLALAIGPGSREFALLFRAEAQSAKILLQYRRIEQHFFFAFSYLASLFYRRHFFRAHLLLAVVSLLPLIHVGSMTPRAGLFLQGHCPWATIELASFE